MLAVETVPEARRVVALRVAVSVAERAPVTPRVAHLVRVRVRVRVRVSVRVRVRVRVRPLVAHHAVVAF